MRDKIEIMEEADAGTHGAYFVCGYVLVDHRPARARAGSASRAGGTDPGAGVSDGGIAGNRRI